MTLMVKLVPTIFLALPLLGATVTIEPGDNIADSFLALEANDSLLVGSGIYAETPELLLLLEESAQAGIAVTYAPFIREESALVINELMAKNDTTIADNYGEFDDWIEISNTGTSDINLSGYYLTDDVEDPFVFAFPDTVISPREYFIIWADDNPEQGSMHADFKLSSSGESLFLLYSRNLTKISAMEGGRMAMVNGRFLLLPLQAHRTRVEVLV